MLKIATWNVNSIAVRLDRLLAFLARESPDALCLQELKTTDEKFPFGPLQDAGYHATVYGQNTYNGVAVLTRRKPDAVARGFGDAAPDAEARFLSVRLGDVTVMSAYFPNGQAVGSDKYRYKLEWMQRLRAYLDRRHTPGELLALGGDFNVAPADIDVHDPAAWAGQVLCSDAERAALAAIRDFGLHDSFRRVHPEAVQYTWWDYRMLGFPKNRGLRIDHVYATPALVELCRVCRVDRDERKGEKPSDHAPLIAEFDHPTP
jgi:exodeoxyribonuclease-3